MRGDVITGKLNDIGPADLHGARWSAILLQEPCLLLPSAADDVRFQPRHKIRSKLCMFFTLKPRPAYGQPAVSLL